MAVLSIVYWVVCARRQDEGQEGGLGPGECRDHLSVAACG